MSDYNVIIPHYSVMLAEGLASIIQEQYPFQHQISMELLSAQLNDTYRVTSGQNIYYLRIPRHERYYPITAETYEFEMHLVNFLRKQQLNVSYPIPLKNRKLLGILNAPEGIRYYSLHTHAEGVEPEIDNFDHMKLLGQMLAQFHLLTENYQSKYQGVTWDLDLLVDYGLSRLKKYLPEDLQSEFNSVEKKTKQLVNSFYKLIPEQNSQVWGVIHGNYTTKNLRIDGNKLTLFDFEYCGMGYRIFDFVFLMHKTNPISLKHKSFQRFLQEYQRHRPISDEELEALPILSKLALVSRMTRSVGMRDLVGVLWFDQQIRHDLKILKSVL